MNSYKSFKIVLSTLPLQRASDWAILRINTNSLTLPHHSKYCHSAGRGWCEYWSEETRHPSCPIVIQSNTTEWWYAYHYHYFRYATHCRLLPRALSRRIIFAIAFPHFLFAIYSTCCRMAHIFCRVWSMAPNSIKMPPKAPEIGKCYIRLLYFKKYVLIFSSIFSQLTATPDTTVRFLTR